jgi:hypothetical protein
MSGFKIGTMEIDKDKIEGLTMSNADLGAELMTLAYCDEEGFQFEFKTPKNASARPLQTMCCVVGGGRYIPVEVSFLGSGVCRIVIQVPDLGSLFKDKEKIEFVAVHTKTEEEAENERAEADEEWRDCRYTGHLHPSRWGFSRQ